jgi:hypothetical protein
MAASTTALRAACAALRPGGGDCERDGVVIAIDNDECIGSWADMSLLHSVYKVVLKSDPSPAVFADMFTATACVRPGLRQLYDTVLELKARGVVHSVYMCTAASDSTGWVSFLRDALEAWYGQRVYDGVVDAERMHKWHASQGSDAMTAEGGAVKDMHFIRELAGVSADVPVVMVDDRPEFVVNGYTIGVPPFDVAVNLVAVARRFVCGWTAKLECRLRSRLQVKWQAFLRDPSSFSVAWKDDVLLHGAAALHDLALQLHVDLEGASDGDGAAAVEVLKRRQGSASAAEHDDETKDCEARR